MHSEDYTTLKEGQELILGELRTINGTVQRHEEEIFGNNARKIRGMKGRLRNLEQWITQAKAVIAVLIFLLSVVGITNLAILFGGN